MDDQACWVQGEEITRTLPWGEEWYPPADYAGIFGPPQRGTIPMTHLINTCHQTDEGENTLSVQEGLKVHLIMMADGNGDTMLRFW